jgi:alpha-galactosidase
MLKSRCAIPFLTAFTWIVFAATVGAQTAGLVAPEELQKRDQWVKTHLSENHPPFSFTYDDKTSDGLLSAWNKKADSKKLDERRVQKTLVWTDPKTSLEVRCVAVEYSDFPVVEWTVYFRNAGTADTPILERIQALDIRVERGEGGEFLLRGNRGDDNGPSGYQPFELALGPNANKKFAAEGGRPTNGGAFPYYNLAMPGGGLILAVGWPGQWAADFTRDAGNALQITAGQELTHLRLKPGEEIRTPLVAMLFWDGKDAVRAQNLWRRWMIADNLPKLAGKRIAPLLWFCSYAYFDSGTKYNESGEKQFIDILAKNGIRCDMWWMDAGWYPCKGIWQNTGTWEPDPERFPNGLKAVSDQVHDKGMKMIVWFEPERVAGDSWLAKNHPEWLLGGTLLNLGNAEARTWLTDHIDTLLAKQGIDYYRQDFNLDPLGFWRNNDTPDRQGITENLHVQGYLAYWDELRRRHPDMLIDSCASGGRRNDLETMRRAVPLLRSDYQWGSLDTTAGNQGHTYGLASWIPYFGQGVYMNDEVVYCARSYMCPGFCVAADIRSDRMDWKIYRQLVDQWREVADCYLGDYYPLAPYSLAADVWMVWQFNRPEQGDGLVQAFRREKSDYESVRVKLHGLQADAVYALKNLDQTDAIQMTGRELMETGLPIAIATSPGSVLIKYSRVNK